MKQCSECRFWSPDIEKSQFSQHAIHRALLEKSPKYAASHSDGSSDHLKGLSPFIAGKQWDVSFTNSEERSLSNSALCRRNPPSVDADGNATWPLTDEFDWCGEWSLPDE